MNFFSGPIVRMLIAERVGPASRSYPAPKDGEITIEYLVRRVANGIISANQDECWDFDTLGEDTYGKISIHGKTLSTHRLTYQLSNGPIPKGKLILHSCDRKPCCNPSHLRAGTRSENTKDFYDRDPKTKTSLVYSQPYQAAKMLGIDTQEIRNLVLSREIPIAYPTHCSRYWIPNAWIEERLKEATVSHG